MKQTVKIEISGESLAEVIKKEKALRQLSKIDTKVLIALGEKGPSLINSRVKGPLIRKQLGL